MSEAAEVTLSRVINGKKETRKVTSTFYGNINKNPQYNGGWHLEEPEEVQQLRNSTEGGTVDTGSTEPVAPEPRKRRSSAEVAAEKAAKATAKPAVDATDLNKIG